MGLIGIAVYLIIITLVAVVLGRYIFHVLERHPSRLDPVANRVEGVIFRLAGTDTHNEQTWLQYFGQLLLVNLFFMLLIYAVLRLQGSLPWNPTHVADMRWDTAFNTAASFVANCNWQAYSGEQALSQFSQLVGIVFAMVVTPATGLVMAAAFVRAFVGQRKTLGNFTVDLVRVIVRIYLPVSIVFAVVLVGLGVPNTLAGPAVAHTLSGLHQFISRGPVAALEAIKMFGNNGGGFFNANSAHPFENPSALTNILEIMAMSAMPMALIFTFGEYIKNRRQAWVIYVVTGVVFLAGTLLVYGQELAGNPILLHVLGIHGANLVGKELRFGIGDTALFVSSTTAFTTGAVNAMHDSLLPLSGGVAMLFMMLNTIFGAVGAGLLNILMMMVVTVFIAGLMVGRTPEFLGKKIEAKEVKLAVVAMLMHPLIILAPTAFALVHPVGTSSILNPAFHGLSEVLYAFSSAAANNGSAFAGLNANTPFYNVTIGLTILIGRYLSVAALLAMGGSLAVKKVVPASEGTLRTDTYTFGWIYMAVVMIVSALTFFPGLALGPIAEQLAMGAGKLF